MVNGKKREMKLERDQTMGVSVGVDPPLAVFRAFFGLLLCSIRGMRWKALNQNVETGSLSDRPGTTNGIRVQKQEVSLGQQCFSQ